MRAADCFADQACTLVGTGAAAVGEVRKGVGAAPARLLDDVSFTNLAGSMLPRLASLPLSGDRFSIYTAGNGLASASLAQEGTARVWDLRLPAGTYTVWVTQSGG